MEKNADPKSKVNLKEQEKKKPYVAGEKTGSPGGTVREMICTTAKRGGESRRAQRVHGLRNCEKKKEGGAAQSLGGGGKKI